MDIDQLESLNLNNDEILFMLADYLKQPNPESYILQVGTLRSKWNMMDSHMPLYLELFLHRDMFDATQLANFYYLNQDITYESLVVGIIWMFMDNANALYFISVVNQLFTTEPDEDFTFELLDMIQTQTVLDIPPVVQDIITLQVPDRGLNGTGVNDINEWLTRHLYTFSPTVSKPVYVRDIEVDTEDVPLLEFYEVPSDPKKLADYTLQTIKKYDGQVDESVAYNQLVETFSSMDQKTREDTAKQLSIDFSNLTDIRKNHALTQMFGPVNPLRIENWASIMTSSGVYDINKIFGGPRMFLDNSFTFTDNDFEQEDDSPDWFTGECFYCHNKIPNRRWAVRLPHWAGGWMGCFCSWDCVRYELVSPLPDLSESTDSHKHTGRVCDKRKLEEIDKVEEFIGKETMDNIRLQLIMIDNYESWIDQVGIAEEDFDISFLMSNDEEDYDINLL